MPPARLRTRRPWLLLHRGCALRALALGGATAALLLSVSCSSTVRRARPRAQALPAATVTLPAVLRGVIGAEATLRGLEPLLVSGYGLVVGLNGTGSEDIPSPVRAMMEREMALKGVGQETMGMGDVTPTQLLNDHNTAVVLVQAVIPPGAPKGWRFDVFVTALPGTSTTSLEGGRLWTTDLQPGLPVPGGPQRKKLAEARGEIFINPFAEPPSKDEPETDAIDRRSGRILNGGVVVEPTPLVLLLNTPSHARARAIASAINSRFPRGPGDRKPTAIPRNEERIE
ncbi:MAG: hypothetical protein D6824_09975, partial [Planctomycetota bacterium]